MDEETLCPCCQETEGLKREYSSASLKKLKLALVAIWREEEEAQRQRAEEANQWSP